MTAWAESYVAVPAHLALTNEQYFDVFRDLAEAALNNKPDGEGPWDLEVKARWITPAARQLKDENEPT